MRYHLIKHTLVGLGLTALLLCGCSKADPQQTNPTTQPAATAPTEQAETCTVRFVDPNGALLYTDTVTAGTAAHPPQNPIMPYGWVFSHWDGDFTHVSGDMTVKAVATEIGTAPNVLSLSGAYARQGSNATVSLRLGGSVELCAFNIRIQYDPMQLDFVELRYPDPMVDANCIAQDGIIYLNFAGSQNTLGDVDLTDLVFYAKGAAGQTQITVEVLELITFTEDGSFLEPQYTVIPGTVTIAEG